MRVLVVDDSLTIRTIIKKVLKGLGYEDVAEAADGVLAIAAYQECRPDLMLVDWNMPNMDGLTLVKKIREVDKCVKILMVTTEAEKNRVVSAIQAGVNNYVIKPFTPDALKDKIDQTLVKQAQMSA
jgi:two-component system, chemotaxis family, chemotaxis protein CheY